MSTLMYPDTPLEFSLDEPPTLPTRSPSGRPIKARVVRAMAEQHEAARQASDALDHLVQKLRLVISEGPPVPAPSGAPPYILFVDDERPNLTVWQAVCEKHFPVLTATDAIAALGLFREHEIAVIVADQRMPQMTGVQLLEHVRRLYPDTVRMLITAYSDMTVAVDAINRCGVAAYLKKPCSPSEMLQAVQKGVAQYAARRVIAAE